MSNADWWAAKLAGTTATPQVGRPANMVPMPPSQQPMAPMPTFQPPQVSKAQSANQHSTCPDCGSGNYFAFQNSAPRCYDCGYPVQQWGSRYGAGTGARVEGTTQAAIGNDTTSNWNPQGIIGRVD